VLQYIATVGVALYRDREREGRKRVYGSGAGRKSHVVTTVVSAGVPASSAQIHTPPGSLTLHSLVSLSRNAPHRSRFPAWLASKVLELWRERRRRRRVSWSLQQYCSCSSSHPTQVLARSARRLGSGERLGSASLKCATWRSSEALGPRVASLERLGERPSAYLNHWVHIYTYRMVCLGISLGTSIPYHTELSSVC
ncbi:hypothetical protein B296_00051019, partial [Ensete ventricosum]